MAFKSRNKDPWFRKPEAILHMREKFIERGIAEGRVLPSDTPTFYTNYKEPLKPVKDGYGYLGTLATDESRNYIQCHICGNLFKALGAHLRQHELTSVQYKEMFQLSRSTSLVGESTREAYIKAREVRSKEEMIDKLKAYHDAVANGTRTPNKSKGNTGMKWSLEQRNKTGLCPDQTLAVLKAFADEIGHTPSYAEFRDKYNGRYFGPIKTHFGGWDNAIRLAGMVSITDQYRQATTPEMLITYLQDFYKRNKRTPMNSDFNRGIIVGRHFYYREFGTLNNARVEAGIPAVIPMPGRRFLEIPADEYMQYEQLVYMNPSKRARRAKSVLKDYPWEIKDQVDIKRKVTQ